MALSPLRAAISVWGSLRAAAIVYFVFLNEVKWSLQSVDRPTPVTFRGGFALIWRVVNAVRGTRLFLWVWVIFGFWTFFLISEFLDAISYDFCSEFRVMVTGGGLAGKYSPRGNFSAPHYFFFLPFRMRTTVRDGGGPPPFLRGDSAALSFYTVAYFRRSVVCVSHFP